MANIIKKNLTIYDFDEGAKKCLETLGINCVGVDENGFSIYECFDGQIQLIVTDRGHFCHFEANIDDLGDLEKLHKAYNIIGGFLPLLGESNVEDEEDEDCENLGLPFPLPKGAKVITGNSIEEIMSKISNEIASKVEKSEKGGNDDGKGNSRSRKKN